MLVFLVGSSSMLVFLVGSSSMLVLVLVDDVVCDVSFFRVETDSDEDNVFSAAQEFFIIFH
ncbi:MAG: hypothetical protein GY940_24685, partial [bacterium]|nr:hypothetical protein [bacterium]